MVPVAHCDGKTPFTQGPRLTVAAGLQVLVWDLFVIILVGGPPGKVPRPIAGGRRLPADATRLHG